MNEHNAIYIEMITVINICLYIVNKNVCNMSTALFYSFVFISAGSC